MFTLQETVDMDSLTQAALGASVAHACWHRPMGRKALAWGAVLGTLPDLDIALYPVLNDIQRLYWHRGESHSIWFAVLGGMMLAWVLRQWRWKKVLSLHRAITGICLILLTHILIDYFTIYGTQLLAPLSRYGFARGNLFIIDPLYTLPLMAGILGAFFCSGKTAVRANFVGIIVSSLYALFSLFSHGYADHIFKQQLAERQVHVTASITNATPFNTLLWRHVAQTDDGFLIGYFSIIADDPQTPIRFDRVEQNKHLVAGDRDQPNVRTIEWFSKGFWVAREKDGVLTLSDLRFGEFRFNDTAPPEKWQYIFVWEIPKHRTACRPDHGRSAIQEQPFLCSGSVL
jgi:inner membrane protein